MSYWAKSKIFTLTTKKTKQKQYWSLFEVLFQNWSYDLIQPPHYFDT